MLEFQLFRMKVHPSKQIDMFEEGKTASEILKDIIISHPESELWKGTIWHIGNILSIDEYAYYLRVGRTTKSTIEIYEGGNFLDQEFETAPYTHVILDLNMEICAIAKKTKLSPKTVGIARQLCRLLNKSDRAQILQAEIEIDEINDPYNFITYLFKAYNILKFSMTVSRPNQLEEKYDFIKTHQLLLKDTNADSGKTEIKGENLNPDRLEELTRSVASFGDNASALMVLEEGDKAVRKQLIGNPVVISQDDIIENEQRKSLLHRLRKIYNKIRGNND